MQLVGDFSFYSKNMTKKNTYLIKIWHIVRSELDYHTSNINATSSI